MHALHERNSILAWTDRLDKPITGNGGAAREKKLNKPITGWGSSSPVIHPNNKMTNPHTFWDTVRITARHNVVLQLKGEALKSGRLHFWCRIFRHRIHLYNLNRPTSDWWCGMPSEMRVNMDVFGLQGVLLVVLWKVGRRGTQNPWWRLYLGPEWWGAVCHMWGDEGLKGLLDKRAPVLLERRRSPWVQRVVLLMKLMRCKHSGWLEIRESGKKL